MVSGLDLLRGTTTEEVQPTSARSGLDLLKPKEEVVVTPTTEVPIIDDRAKGLYSKSLVPGFSAKIGRLGYGPQPEGGFDEVGVPLNKEGKPYIEPIKASGPIAETLQGFSTLATHPMETVKGAIDFALSIPGFMTGLVNAAGFAGSEIVNQIAVDNRLNLEEVYNRASEGMMKGMEFFEPAKRMLVGEPTEESQLVGQVAMAPLTAISALGQGAADWEGFKDYPNIRGAYRFLGDIAGLMAMGFILHGPGKAEFAKDVEGIVREGNNIRAKEQQIGTIPNEIVQAAEKKVLEMQKVQLELRAEEAGRKLSSDAMIREELGRQAEEIAKAKIRPVEETGLELPKVEEVKSGIKLIKDKEVKVEETKIEEPKLIPEIDEQAGEEIPNIKGEDSLFFQDKETTDAFKNIYEERQKAVESEPEVMTQKLINDVNRWYHGDETIDIDATRNLLSKFASRADELRNDFFLSGVDHLQWKEVVQEAASWARDLDHKINLRTDDGTKLYSGIPIDEATKQLINAAKKVSEYTKTARGLKQFKPVQAAKMLKDELVRSFVDRSGNIRQDLLENLGDKGYEVVQRMYLAKGASSVASNMLKQMRKEVYGELSKGDKEILDNLILSDRIADIAKYKTEKQFKFPEGLSPEGAVSYSELFPFIEKLSPEKANTIRQRAKAYFEWMKQPLKDMLEAGLISETEFEALSSHNYRRLKLVDVYDKRYTTKIGKKTRTVYDSGVEALARGRDTDIYEPSSQIMALEVFNRAYGRILNNKANQELLKVARSDKLNPFVRTKDSTSDKIPTGWNRVFVYEGGERKAIYLSPEMNKEWITNSPEMSYRLGQFLRYSSGSPVLRTFATGINWGFALANLPRDVMHLWYAARSFEDGQWKPIYSPHLPIYGLQIGRDLANIFPDALLRKGKYEDYIKEGGGMEFLVHQGRLFQRGRHLEGPMDKVFDFMGYFGETSEIMTRLAIRERALRQGKSPQEATFIARDYMDFGQGGGIAKALDNGLPYLNASIQGTRGLLRSFKDNPLVSTYKLSQFAALTTGIYIAANRSHPNTMEAVKKDIQSQNNLIIPIGDDQGFEDERGQVRYPYIKIPLDPGQKFFKKFFESSTDKWLGNEVDVDGTVNSLEQLSPVGVSSLPPTISGALGYVMNKDFWRNEDIWTKTDKPFNWPESREEYIPGRTPQAFIDLGEKTGLSPERTKYAVEELVTNGTVWSYLLGEGYNKLFVDLPKDQKEKHLAEVLSKTPVVKRFFGITNPYSQFGGKIDEAKQESDIERWIQNRGLDARVEDYLYKEGSRKEVIDYMKSFKDKDVFDRLKDRFVFQERIKNLNNRSFWLRLKGLTTEARAKVYVNRLNSANEDQREELRKELNVVIKAGGIVTPEFRNEVSKLNSP